MQTHMVTCSQLEGLESPQLISDRPRAACSRVRRHQAASVRRGEANAKRVTRAALQLLASTRRHIQPSFMTLGSYKKLVLQVTISGRLKWGAPSRPRPRVYPAGQV